jgi:hypothetical protein
VVVGPIGVAHASSLYRGPSNGTLHGLAYWQQPPAGDFAYVITAAQISVVFVGAGQPAVVGGAELGDTGPASS